MSATVSAERLKLGLDFSERFAHAVGEYDIARELGITLVATVRAETVLIRLERTADNGGLVYLTKHVFYDEIKEPGRQAFEAARMAHALIAELLLQTEAEATPMGTS